MNIPPRKPVSLVTDREILKYALIAKVTGVLVFGTIFLSLAVLLSSREVGGVDLAVVELICASLLVVATVFLVTRYKINPLPIRVELKNDSIVLYFRYRFVSIPLSEIRAIRQPNFFETLLCLRPTEALVVVGPTGVPYVIQPGTFEDPINAGQALNSFFHPRLVELTRQMPKLQWNLVEPGHLILYGVFGMVVGFFATPFVYLLAPQIPPLVSVFVGTLLLPLLKLAFGSQRLVFVPEGIIVRSRRTSTMIKFDNVDLLTIVIAADKETLTIHLPHKPGALTLTSKLADYPQIRDFIILQCTRATVKGVTDPHKLALCALDTPLNEIHPPVIDEQKTLPTENPDNLSRAQIWAANRQKAGRQ